MAYFLIGISFVMMTYIYKTNHKKVAKYNSPQIIKERSTSQGKRLTFSPLILIPHFFLHLTSQPNLTSTSPNKNIQIPLFPFLPSNPIPHTHRTLYLNPFRLVLVVSLMLNNLIKGCSNSHPLSKRSKRS